MPTKGLVRSRYAVAVVFTMHRKGFHKNECCLLNKANKSKLESAEKRKILLTQLQKVRMYICPYVVVKSERLGKGLLFVRSEHGFNNWIYWNNIDCFGRPLNRSLTVEFVTLDEWGEFQNMLIALC